MTVDLDEVGLVGQHRGRDEEESRDAAFFQHWHGDVDLAPERIVKCEARDVIRKISMPDELGEFLSGKNRTQCRDVINDPMEAFSGDGARTGTMSASVEVMEHHAVYAE